MGCRLNGDVFSLLHERICYGRSVKSFTFTLLWQFFLYLVQQPPSLCKLDLFQASALHHTSPKHDTKLLSMISLTTQLTDWVVQTPFFSIYWGKAKLADWGWKVYAYCKPLLRVLISDYVPAYIKTNTLLFTLHKYYPQNHRMNIGNYKDDLLICHFVVFMIY